MTNGTEQTRPGITRLAQISGRNALSWQEKFRLDVHYVDHHTFVGDLLILLGTVRSVIARDGISEEGHTDQLGLSRLSESKCRQPQGARMTAAVLIIGAGISADRKAGVGAAVRPRVAGATTVIGVPLDQGYLGHPTISRSRGRTARV
jgi:hypothetical protein